MRNFIQTFCLLFFVSAHSSGQSIFELHTQKIDLPESAELYQAFTHFNVLQIESRELADFMKSSGSVEKKMNLDFPELGKKTLVLHPRHLLKNDYKCLSDNQVAAKGAAALGQITWQGNIADIPGSKVSITISQDYVFGSIHTDTATWFIEPVSNLLPHAAPGNYVLYRTTDILPNAGLICGVEEVSKQKKQYAREIESGTCRNIDLAIASTYDMKQRYGSVAAVEIHNIGVMNEVAGDFDDVFADQFFFLIVAQYISTSSNSTLDSTLTSTSSADALLANFAEWSENGAFGTSSDIGILWTTRDICVGGGCAVIGYSWVGGVCGTERYLVLEDYDGVNPNGSGWKLRVLTSHEIGHQMGCNHIGTIPATIMYPAAVNTNAWAPESIQEVNDFIPSLWCVAACGANFGTTDLTILEGGTTGQYLPAGAPTCGMGYLEKTIPVHYSGNSSGDTIRARVTGGSAVEGIDFQWIDSVLIFPPGTVVQTKNLRIGLVNDALKEVGKTIFLSLEGASAGIQNNIVVHLTDDDRDPAESFFQANQPGLFNSFPTTAPFLGGNSDAQTQFIISAGELLEMGLKANDEIFGLDFTVSTKNSTQPFNGFTIGIKHTSNSIDFIDDLELDGFTVVHSSDYTTVLGLNHFDFSTNFIWDGVSNLAFKICFDNSSVTDNDKAYTFSGGQVNALLGGTGNPGSGCNLPTLPVSTIIGRRPRVRLYRGTDIAVDLNDAADTELKRGQTAYFKDAQNEFILAITQTSSYADAGCVHVQIDRAGIGQQAVGWLPSGAFISDKTFLVTMDNPNANYDLTLYYSQEEMAIWGDNKAALNIIKANKPFAIATAQDCSIQTNLSRTVFGSTEAPESYYSFKGSFRRPAGFALTNASAVKTRDGEVTLEGASTAESVFLYPNPAVSSVTIVGKPAEVYTLAFYDVAGQLALEQTLSSLSGISLEKLPSSVYFVQITSQSGVVTRTRLVKL